MANPSTIRLLKEILSGDIEWIYAHITDKAVEWALAGLTDEANNLLEQLWSFKIPHPQHLRSEDEGFAVLWAVTKKYPSKIPFALKDIKEVEDSTYNKLLYGNITVAYGGKTYVRQILENSKNVLETGKVVGYEYFKTALYGAVLAARNNLDKEATYFIERWGEGHKMYWSNYMLSDIMLERKCLEYLLRGILAPVFEVNKSLCESETQKIINQLHKRVQNGRTLVYGDLSWKQLLTVISNLAIEQKAIDFSTKILINNSLLRPPATIEEIHATEHRLKIKLPDDYKNFLLTSNGFECFSYTGVTLLSVEKIDLLLNYERDLIDIWSDEISSSGLSNNYKLINSIIIGGYEQEQQLYLVPLQNGNWECWHSAPWRPGEVKYENFRFYMEDELQELEEESI